MTPAVGLYLVACCAAVYTDVRWRRIPNALNYATALGIMALCAQGGAGPLSTAIVAFTTAILVGSFAFGAGWIGGGDVKLLACGVAAIGVPAFFLVLFYITTAGGILALVFALRERRLHAVVSNIACNTLSGKLRALPAVGSKRVPYALAICAGALFYAASESFTPWFRFAH